MSGGGELSAIECYLQEMHGEVGANHGQFGAKTRALSANSMCRCPHRQSFVASSCCPAAAHADTCGALLCRCLRWRIHDRREVVGWWQSGLGSRQARPGRSAHWTLLILISAGKLGLPHVISPDLGTILQYLSYLAVVLEYLATVLTIANIYLQWWQSSSSGKMVEAPASEPGDSSRNSTPKDAPRGENLSGGEIRKTGYEKSSHS